MTHRLGKGDIVRFWSKKVHLYKTIYGVTPDDVFEIAHLEMRQGKRVLYLATPTRELWIPAYSSALRLVQKRKETETV